MSKVSTQQLAAENSEITLRYKLGVEHFLVTEFNGNYPDFDGIFRLRVWDEKNQCHNTKTLFGYQLKAVDSLKDQTFYCSRELINKLNDPTANTPEILFIVDNSQKRMYWFCLNGEAKKQYKIDADEKGKNLILKEQEVIPDGSAAEALRIKFEGIAEEFIYDKKKVSSIKELEKKYSADAISFLGILHLLRIIRRDEAPKIIADVLSVDLKHVEYILLQLSNERVILSTYNYCLVENDEIGAACIAKSLANIDLGKLTNRIQDPKQIAHLLSRIAIIDGLKPLKFLHGITAEIRSKINKNESNDSIFQLLEYLENFAFRTPAAALQIVNAVINRGPVKTKTHKTKWGSYDGKDYKSLLQQSIKILQAIRYLKTNKVLNVLAKLANSSEKEVATAALQSIHNLSRYNLNAINRIRLNPQLEIIKELNSWPISKLKKNLVVITQIAHDLFEASAEGTSNPDYKTLNIEWRALLATKDLKQIRKRLVTLLQKIFEESGSMNERLSILKILEDASKTPIHSAYNKDLEKMILEDTNVLIEWYLKKIKSMEPILMKEIEEQKEWFIQRWKKKKLSKIKDLEEALNNSKDYEYFRILVGDDHGFSRAMDYTKIEDFRKKKIDAFIQQIKPKNLQEWEARILKIASYADLESHGSFNYFRFFLRRFGQEYPQETLILLKQNEKSLELFLWNLIAGVCQSISHEQGKAALQAWIVKGKFLTESAASISLFSEIDQQFIESIFKKAKETGNATSMETLIEAISRKYSGEQYLKKMFLNCLRELRKMEQTNVISRIWLYSKKLLNELSSDEADIIVTSLVPVKDVTHDADYTLKPIFTNYPEKFVEYFRQRIVFQKKKGDRFSYMITPFRHMHDLSEVMKPHRKLVFNQLMDWYREADWLYSHSASELLKLVYSLNELEEEVLPLASSKKPDEAKIAYEIIHDFGRSALGHKITKEFVKYQFSNEKWMNSIMASMSETGVVSGEEGLLNAYIGKREEIRKWKRNKNPNVRKFASQYEGHLTADIEYEKRRKDEELELLKRGIH